MQTQPRIFSKLAVALLSFMLCMTSCDNATGPSTYAISTADSLLISKVPLYSMTVVALFPTGDTAFKSTAKTEALWDRSKKALSISGQINFGLDSFDHVSTVVLGADSVGSAASLYLDGSTYKTRSRAGEIYVTEFDPEFHKLSGTFNLVLTSSKDGIVDSIFVRGAYHSINLQTKQDLADARLTYDGRSYPPILGTRDTSGVSIMGQLVASVTGCHSVSDYIYETVSIRLKGVKAGSYTLKDGSKWSYDYSLRVTHPRCPPGSSTTTSALITDSVVVTLFDVDRRRISGRFTIMGKPGTFENMSWQN